MLILIKSDYNYGNRIPVSYTHLDVYKRQSIVLLQIKNLWKKEALSMPVTPTIEVDDTLKERSSHGSFELPIETYTDNCEIFHSLYNHWHDAVSYTHLDVYKRQYQMSDIFPIPHWHSEYSILQ